MFTNVIGFIMNRVSTKSRDLTPGFGNKKTFQSMRDAKADN